MRGGGGKKNDIAVGGKDHGGLARPPGQAHRRVGEGADAGRQGKRGASKIPGQPNRGERPKKDPLQRFLDKKQIQHNLVRVSPQNRKPSVMKDQKQYNIQVQGQSIQRKEQPIADRQIILERKKERRIEKAQQEKNRQLLNRPAQNVQPRKELTEEQKKRLQQSAQTRKKSAEEQKRKFQPNKKAYEEERPKHYP